MNTATNIIDVDELQFNEKVIEGSKEKLIIVDFGRLGVVHVNN